MTDNFEFPGLGHRLVILGQTGSGKSVAGAWHLWQHTEQNKHIPWIIFNPKRDELLDSIGAEPLKLKDGLSKKLPGRLFVTHPVAESDDDYHVDNIIRQAMDRGRVGLYFDEGYSIPKNSKPFRRALTQGRSKQVPMITLSQRPVFMDKFVFTEASMYRIFYLLDKADRVRVRENTGIEITDDLPSYRSHWYDVGKRTRYLFKPGPNDSEVKHMFLSRDSETKSRRWI